MEFKRSEIVHSLARKALDHLRLSSGEIERSCWMIVHEYRHGVLPSEYDIREIDESLYLSVLEEARQKNSQLDF